MLFFVCVIIGVWQCSEAYDYGCWKQTNVSLLVYVSNQYEINATSLANEGGSIFFSYRREKARESREVLRLPCHRLDEAASYLTARRERIRFFYPPPPESDSTSGLCAQVTKRDFATAISDLVAEQRIEQTIVFYTGEYASDALALVDKFDESSARSVLWSLTPGSVIDDVTGAMETAGSCMKTYILLVDTKTAATILTAARAANMTYSDWMFVVVSTDPEDKIYWEGWLVAGERVVILAPEPVRDGPCDYKVYSDASRRLTLSVVALRREKMEIVGEWLPSSGLNTHMDDFWYFDKFYDKTFKIATIQLDVFHYTREEGNTTVWDGIAMEMLKTMAEELNFTYEIVPSVDGKWGAPEGNDSWNGMVGMVVRGEVDFAFAKFTISAIRDTVVDFATPFWYEPTVIVMSKPAEDSLWIYAGPFTEEVWYYFLAITPFCGALVAVLLQWERLLKGETSGDFLGALSKGLWYSYGAFMQQSWDYNPVTQSLRFVVGFWWFFVIVVMATYTGNLIAVLAVPKSTLPVQTLSELAAQNKYKYGVMDGSALHTLFSSSEAEIYKRLFERSIGDEENRVSSHQDGLKRVKEGDYIYIGEKTGVASVVYSDCQYALGREQFNPGSFAAAFPANSKYLPIFNEKINAFTESGMIEKWKRRYYPNDRCTLEAASKAKMPDPASLRDFQGALLILGLGLGIGFTLLVIELLSPGVYSKWVRKRQGGGAKNRTFLEAIQGRLVGMGLVAGRVDNTNLQGDPESVLRDVPPQTVIHNGVEELGIPVTSNGFRQTSIMHRKNTPKTKESYKLRTIRRFSQENGVTSNGSVNSHRF